jgi:cyclic beta-1,2-glucan synthetase
LDWRTNRVISNRLSSAGIDPCAALGTTIELPPNGIIELVFFLGQAANVEEARKLIARYRTADLDAVRSVVDRYWNDVLGAVQVKTPDRSMDVMLNGWLLYQTPACRVWGRSGFYQASGAYGFRDQLQDGMALATARPALTREHLLRAAARQFVEGDVQHWWLPYSGQGVRTRISDDCGWLAYAVAHYVDVTRDAAVLDEVVPFIEGQRLEPGEHDSFFQPTISDETATLFAHCARALDQSLALGSHGLPLIASGDWNGGMNRVGEQGRGESVWVGWLLHAALAAFASLADARGEAIRAAAWRRHATTLRVSLEGEAWDGDWYRRGWFDDGTPLGSVASEACRIDSIAQSWSVLSGAADPGRAAHAMAAVERELISPKDGLALLFTPPFDKTSLEPPRTGLHQGLSAGHPRERRPIHPWRPVVGDGVRRARRRRQGGPTVLAAKPDQPRPYAGGCAPLSRRAIRGRSRRLFRAWPCGAGRVDVVHGLCRLDAARRHRGHPGIAVPRQVPAP